MTFADGKPINDQTSADWLAIHGANVWGYDKVSFEDRLAWVRENHEWILAVAEAPLDRLEWTKADKPWQFLAWCFEWRALAYHGAGYVSCLPIALDGSCNGLQHFSAMMRDEVGAAAVNLTPADKPQDVYQAVADRLTRKLRRMNNPIAAQWLAFGINRKTTKRCVMVLPYAGTVFAFRRFVHEHMVDRREAGEPWPFDGKGWEAARFLAPLIRQSISEIVVSAVQVMEWLCVVAGKVAAEGHPVSWTAPTGFPVLQEYYQQTSKRVITTTVHGRMKLSLRESTGVVDRRRQANGVSPNLVHSLDAAALVFCVDGCMSAGIRHFAMIHDSYGTLAADTEAMTVCLREAFIGTYSTDVLEAFRREVQPLCLNEELPPPPDKGSLDLDLVRQSRFFFA